MDVSAFPTALVVAAMNLLLSALAAVLALWLLGNRNGELAAPGELASGPDRARRGRTRAAGGERRPTSHGTGLMPPM